MAKKKIVRDKQEPQESILPIKWYVPDSMHSIYASNILVQILENEFKLSFFETKPPIRINESYPVATEIRADCVASVILHPKKVISLIEALQRQVNVFVEREQDGAIVPTGQEKPS